MNFFLLFDRRLEIIILFAHMCLKMMEDMVDYYYFTNQSLSVS